MPATGWKKMSPNELLLAKAMYHDQGLLPREIAEHLGRHRSVLERLLVKQTPRSQQGRPPCLTDGQIQVLTTKLDELIRKADPRPMRPM